MTSDRPAASTLKNAPLAHSVPEFSRVIAVETIRQDGVTRSVAATPTERQALARRFALTAIDDLSAEVRLQPTGRGDMIRVEGHLKASVTQTCVVSLNPIASMLSEPFVAVFAPPAARSAESGGDVTWHADADDEDEPEPLLHGRIDIGEFVAQTLSLALDPYPRDPEAHVDDTIALVGGDVVGDRAADREDGGNPFAVLAKFRSDGDERG